jgi:hypothetical protein
VTDVSEVLSLSSGAWLWRQYPPLKRRSVSTRLHIVTFSWVLYSRWNFITLQKSIHYS